MEPLTDLEVIDDPATAVVALDPIRARLLAELAEPGSAASLANRMGLARQKVNYHLRALEAHGLVRPVEKRRWGGIIERRVVATAASYVVSPAALGDVASDPDRASDRLSARYVVALAARVVGEIGELLRSSKEQRKHLATLGLDTEIRFRSPTERAAFTAELTQAIAGLVARYHDAAAPGGRAHRLILVAHPLPRKTGS